jgi:glycosyltransferase involved in cell wall biosynthesis
VITVSRGRVLHVVHQYLPDHLGGTEIYTQTLASSLLGHGYQSIVFTRQRGDRPRIVRDDRESIPIYRAIAGRDSAQAVFLSTFGNRFLQGAFAETLQATSPDLVHIHHLMGLPAAIPRLAREAGLPVLATLHDYWFLCPNAQLLTNYDHSICSGPRLWLNCARCTAARLEQPVLNLGALLIAGVIGWRAHLLRQAMRHVDAFIAPTAFVRDLFVQKGLFMAEQVVHLPHGIALDGVRPRQPRPARAPLRVSYLGGISWQKGVHVLVDAVMQLDPASVILKVYGDHTAFPGYTQGLTHQAAGHPNIAFLGRQTRGEVWKALAQTDVLVVPSLWYETAVLVVQEAFAAGVPVVASRLGALQERVHHGVDGYLYPPGDSQALATILEGLAADDDRLAQLQASIRPVFTIDQHVEQVLALYRSLATGHNRR